MRMVEICGVDLSQAVCSTSFAQLLGTQELEPDLVNVTFSTHAGLNGRLTRIAAVEPLLSRWGCGLFGTRLGRER